MKKLLLILLFSQSIFAQVYFLGEKSKKSENFQCLPNSLFSQFPTNGSYTCSNQSGVKLFQSFENISDSIYGLHFWSVNIFFDGNFWQACEQDSVEFTLTIYKDKQGYPGKIIDSTNVKVKSVNTTYLMNYLQPIYSYTIFLTKPIFIERGWFSLQAKNKDCLTFICASTDSTSKGTCFIYDGTDFYSMSFPIAYCLLGNPGNCLYPIDVEIIPEDTFATVKWKFVENMEFELEFGEKDFKPGSGQKISVISVNECSLNNLKQYKTYDLYIKSKCGTDIHSFLVGPIRFTTKGCNSKNTCTYKFELMDKIIGDGWNGSGIEIYENNNLIKKITLSHGTHRVFNVNLCDNSDIDLIWRSEAFYDNECSFNLYDAQGILIYSFKKNENPVNNQKFYSFKTECNPSCIKPLSVEILNIEDNKVHFEIKEKQKMTKWQIEYGYYGFSKGSGIKKIINTNPFILDNLQHSTRFQLYIRSICGENDTSSWMGPFLFNTDCPAVGFYPYKEKFDGAFFPPLCWKNIDADGDGYAWERDYNFYLAQEGLYYAKSYSWYPIIIGVLKPDNYLITRKFKVTSPYLVLKFWIASQGGIYWGVNTGEEHYSVLISTTDNNINSFKTVYSETLQDNTWKEVTIPLKDYYNKEIYVAFRHHDCTDELALRLDNISIELTQNIDENKNTECFFYPNPANDLLFLSDAYNVEIYNVMGEKVLDLQNVKTVDITSLSNGFYTLKIFNDKHNKNFKLYVMR